jgi:hypothetical protein
LVYPPFFPPNNHSIYIHLFISIHFYILSYFSAPIYPTVRPSFYPLVHPSLHFFSAGSAPTYTETGIKMRTSEKWLKPSHFSVGIPCTYFRP